MATKYVRGENGSDSNSGDSRAAAYKTLEKAQTVVASGDTIYLSEIIEPIDNAGDLFTVSSLSNVTIRQDPDGDQAKVLLFRRVPTFTVGAGAFFVATIATGLTLVGVCRNLLTNRKADGRAYGWMHLEANAAAVNGGGTQGQWFYDSGTGVLTVCPLAEALPADLTVGYGVASRNAIEFNACTGCSVQGIEFYGVPSALASQAVEFANCTGCFASGCTSRDMGSHAYSSEGNTATGSGNYFYNCRAYTWHAGGTAFVHHASGANITDGVYDSCHCVGGRHLGEDGNVLADQDANTQVCWLAHTDGGGEVLANGGMKLYRCTATETEGEGNIVRTDNNGAVGAVSFANTQIQCFDCDFTSYARMYFNIAANRIGFRRCTLRNITGAALGYGDGAGIYHMLGSGQAVFEYCEFDVNMTHSGGNNYGVFCCQNAADQMHFRNCTFYDRRTGDHLVTLFLHVSSNGIFAGSGCLWVNAKTTSVTNSRLFWGDGSANCTTQHLFTGGNVFVNTTTDATSQAADDDTRSEFATRVGNVTYTDAAATGTLPGIAAGDIALTNGGLASTTRPSGAVVGETGINSRPDNGRYGAWQDGSDASGRTGSRSSGRGRVQR